MELFRLRGMEQKNEMERKNIGDYKSLMDALRAVERDLEELGYINLEVGIFNPKARTIVINTGYGDICYELIRRQK